MTDAILVSDLGKTYRAGFRMRLVQALQGLTLAVPEGSIYGFVGPNGAGKSTTIKMLVGLSAPTRGTARIFGTSIADPRSRERVGYLPENPSFHDFLRPLEVLGYLGRLSGLRGAALRRRSEELLERVGLAHAADLTIRKFSKGMVQRLGLAQAMVHDPPLLILDEPMSGLDPIGRKEVRDLLLELRAQGKTLFFSTHILNDVETICDRVGMVMRGRLVAEGPIATLLDRSVRSVEVRTTPLREDVVRAVRALASAATALPDGHVFAFPGFAEANAVIPRVLAGGGQVLAVQPVRESLEETFVRLATGAATSAREAVAAHG